MMWSSRTFWKITTSPLSRQQGHSYMWRTSWTLFRSRRFKAYKIRIFSSQLWSTQSPSPWIKTFWFGHWAWKLLLFSSRLQGFLSRVRMLQECCFYIWWASGGWADKRQDRVGHKWGQTFSCHPPGGHQVQGPGQVLHNSNININKS